MKGSGREPGEQGSEKNRGCKIREDLVQVLGHHLLGAGPLPVFSSVRKAQSKC